MAKSHKKKGKKKRSKTTFPSSKEGTRQKNDPKIPRSSSIPPANQSKQHKKTLGAKKSSSISHAKSKLNPIEENNTAQVRKSAPRSTSISDAFSNLSLNDSEKPKDKNHTRRNFSTDSTTTGKKSNSRTNTNRYGLEDIAKLISSGKAKNIIIMAGAGISTGSGIPDFRTPGSGLYDNLKKYKIPSPMAIFDLDYFHYDQKPFFTLAKELYPSGKYKPCLPHYFAKLLHDKGLLLRMYTQNIDGLERVAGIPPEKLVEAHGTFSTASCTKCGKKYDGAQIKKKVLEGIIPRCQSSGLCWGVVKPDIVFFGEDLPRRFYYYLRDFPSCDLLIVMGTSLEVEPFANLTSSVRSNCPRLLLNRELVGPFKSKSQRRKQDVGVTGDLAETVNRFVDLIGWKEDFEAVVESAKVDEENDGQLDAASTDSGISSSESSTDSARKKPPLLPPNTDAKRYFHTIRSNPLPSCNSVYITNSARNTSYYNFIRDKTFSGSHYPTNNCSPGAFNSALTIQYAQTTPGKKFGKASSCKNIRTFGVCAATSDNDSSDSDVSSGEDATESSDSLSSLSSDSTS